MDIKTGVAVAVEGVGGDGVVVYTAHTAGQDDTTA
jgi:hypothetical protein